jgi:hypothetical protein
MRQDESRLAEVAETVCEICAACCRESFCHVAMAQNYRIRVHDTTKSAPTVASESQILMQTSEKGLSHN